MATQPCRRAQRVSGASQDVIAWVDHERHADVLLLNATYFTADTQQAITAVLEQGEWSVQQVIAALVTTGG